VSRGDRGVGGSDSWSLVYGCCIVRLDVLPVVVRACGVRGLVAHHRGGTHFCMCGCRCLEYTSSAGVGLLGLHG